MDNPYCKICLCNIEDLAHIFKSCPKVAPLWAQLANQEGWRRSHHLPFREWLVWNLTLINPLDANKDRKNQFAICLWWIWRWKNELTFQNKKIGVQAKVAWVHKYFEEVNSTYSNQSIMHGGGLQYTTIWVLGLYIPKVILL